MIRSRILLKAVSYLLLVGMVYMHVCSAWCGMALGGCSTTREGDHCKKSACSTDKRSDSKGGNCQDLHLSFFKTIGQFSAEKAIEFSKIMETGLPAGLPCYTVCDLEWNQNVIAHTGFHPPPTTADIRILIQSFQI